MDVNTAANEFKERAYKTYLANVYARLMTPGYRLSFEKLREMVGNGQPAPWHEVWACVQLLNSEGLLNVSRDKQQLTVIKASVVGGQQKFEGLLKQLAGKKSRSKVGLPVKSIEEAVGAA